MNFKRRADKPPLLMMVERVRDFPTDPGRPVVTLLRPMPRWLAWLCRRWARQCSTLEPMPVNYDSLMQAEYSLTTTDAVFTQLMCASRPTVTPSAPHTVHLVLTPPQTMLRDARAAQLNGVDPVV